MLAEARRMDTSLAFSRPTFNREWGRRAEAYPSGSIQNRDDHQGNDGRLQGLSTDRLEIESSDEGAKLP